MQVDGSSDNSRYLSHLSCPKAGHARCTTAALAIDPADSSTRSPFFGLSVAIAMIAVVKVLQNAPVSPVSPARGLFC